MSKCSADVLLMWENNPALVWTEYCLLQTRGSIVWKSPLQSLLHSSSRSKTVAKAGASQVVLSDQHYQTPRGDRTPLL